MKSTSELDDNENSFALIVDPDEEDLVEYVLDERNGSNNNKNFEG